MTTSTLPQYTTPESKPEPPRKPVRAERYPHPSLPRESLIVLLPALIGIALLIGWYLLTRNDQNNFVRATPGQVALELLAMVNSGIWFMHIGVTLAEIGIGLVLGLSLAFVTGNGVARSHVLDSAFSPYLAGVQAVPIVAIAPVLITFIGPGLITNGIICALIVFFPMLIATIVGLRGIDPAKRELLESYSATRWQMFVHLELPAALPVLLGGLKVSATLAVVGAVVGEAVSSEAGLGFLIYQSRYVYNTSRVLVGLFTLTALALMLYESVAVAERYLLRWQGKRG